jgi:hypothetical protein
MTICLGADWPQSPSFVQTHRRGVSNREEAMSRELKYPQWQEPFRNAIAEFGTQQLGEKLQKVEAMILDRLQVLSSDIKSLAERQALLDAISIIRILKRDKIYS